MSNKFYLVRHGEAKGNRYGILMGRGDYELTDNGRVQATESINRFLNMDMTKIYSSNLLRAVETAKIIANGLGLNKVEITNQIMERFYGEIEGASKSELKDRFSDEIKSLISLTNSERMMHRFVNSMESGEEVAQRIINYLLKLDQVHNNENILLVTHSGIIGCLLSKLSLRDYDIPAGSGGIDNLGHVEFIIDKGEFVLESSFGIRLGQ